MGLLKQWSALALADYNDDDCGDQAKDGRAIGYDSYDTRNVVFLKQDYKDLPFTPDNDKLAVLAEMARRNRIIRSLSQILKGAPILKELENPPRPDDPDQQD